MTLIPTIDRRRKIVEQTKTEYMKKGGRERGASVRSAGTEEAGRGEGSYVPIRMRRQLPLQNVERGEA